MIVFLGVVNDCEFPALSTSVSTFSVVVGFDAGEGHALAIIDSPQSLVLSFFGEDTDHDGTTNFVLKDE